MDLWQAQNVYYERLQVISREQDVRFSEIWLDRFQKLGKLLGVTVDKTLFARASKPVAVEPIYPDSDLVRKVVAAAASEAVVLSSDGLQITAKPA
jgi:hypothetical protein